MHSSQQGAPVYGRPFLQSQPGMHSRQRRMPQLSAGRQGRCLRLRAGRSSSRLTRGSGRQMPVALAPGRLSRLPWHGTLSLKQLGVARPSRLPGPGLRSQRQQAAVPPMLHRGWLAAVTAMQQQGPLAATLSMQKRGQLCRIGLTCASSGGARQRPGVATLGTWTRPASPGRAAMP